MADLLCSSSTLQNTSTHCIKRQNEAFKLHSTFLAILPCRRPKDPSISSGRILSSTRCSTSSSDYTPRQSSSHTSGNQYREPHLGSVNAKSWLPIDQDADSQFRYINHRNRIARWKKRLGSRKVESVGAVYLQNQLVGKVGVYGRHGNLSMASFGLKSRPQEQKEDLAKKLSRMLPYVVVATALLSLSQPSTFSWFQKKYYAPALGGIMLSIGVQLSVSDFVLVYKRPVPVVLGYIAQYCLKPLIGLAVVSSFGVPAMYSAGFLLTCSVAGAQLSSYATYLADGEVALSIVLTSLTTLSSVFMTPLLTQVLIGSVVPVDVVAMAKSILQVVICPVVAGLALNTYAKPLVDKIRPVMPLMAMICTSLCIGSPLAINRDRIVSPEGFMLLLPVFVFHVLAFIAGYWFSEFGAWKQGKKVSRTLSLCTGMQSSTLAMLLASQFLGCSHSVPPACSVVVMAIVGLGLGSFWGKGYHLRAMLHQFLKADFQGLTA